MYRIPILGGKPEELVRNVHSPPALAPDGVQYAFIRESPAANESQLIIAATDSRPERVLLRRKLPDYLDYPTWSPEGAPLAVVDIPYFKNQARLVTVDVATGTESPLGQEHWHTLRYPRWSSDSRNLIASGRHRQDAKFHLWHISFPQGKIRQITHDLDQYVSVSRSTDDSKIFALQLKEIASLWVTPPDDFAKAKRIETGASLRMSSAWTPDGRVIYHRQAGEDSSILTASADAGNRRTLVSTGLNWAPTVCENGRWIVYNHQPATQRAQLWRMKPDGSERVLLAADTGVTEPHCAPSGDWVVFASTGGQRKWPMLMKVSLNGGTPVALDTGHSHHVAVSPNGKLIAAFHTPDGEGFQNLRTRVAIFSIDGGRPLRILRISRSVQDGVNLRWTPDSRSVMYVDHVNGESNIWMHPIQGGAPRRVTSLRGITIRHFDWSHDGRFLSVEQIARTSDVVSIENMPN
jgi:Tol biopolymer transport system component